MCWCDDHVIIIKINEYWKIFFDTLQLHWLTKLLYYAYLLDNLMMDTFKAKGPNSDVPSVDLCVRYLHVDQPCCSLTFVVWSNLLLWHPWRKRGTLQNDPCLELVFITNYKLCVWIGLTDSLKGLKQISSSNHIKFKLLRLHMVACCLSADMSSSFTCVFRVQ